MTRRIVSHSMDLTQSHFALFGLPETFALDLDRLERARLAVQAQVHPDRHAAGTDRDRRLAMQWAAQANAAYRILKNPLSRAAYLCERRGVPVDAENNTAMPTDFLMQQMQWREALDDIRTRRDRETLKSLLAEVRGQRQQRIDAIGQALDADDAPAAAAGQVRALMFLERFLDELRQADETMSAASI